MKVDEWLAALSAGASLREIARRADLPPATLTRQVRTGEAPPGTIVQIARAYSADPLEGLVAAEIITAEEARGLGGLPVISVTEALARASAEQLGIEVAERLHRAEMAGDLPPLVTVETAEPDPPGRHRLDLLVLPGCETGERDPDCAASECPPQWPDRVSCGLREVERRGAA